MKFEGLMGVVFDCFLNMTELSCDFLRVLVLGEWGSGEVQKQRQLLKVNSATSESGP